MDLKKWAIIGAVFTMILGTVLHFTYEWTGGSTLVGLFSAVNESTFEHLKLLITPMVIFMFVEFFVYQKSVSNFLPSRVLSILVGALSIIVIFYTYTGIIGTNFLFMDILTFFVSVAFAYFVGYKLMNSNYLNSSGAKIFGWVGFILIIAMTAYFTVSPIKIDLFKDPISGGYGIKK